jgi:hypothetical protein
MPKIYEYLFNNTLPQNKNQGDVLYVNDDGKAEWIPLNNLYNIASFKRSFIVEDATERLNLPNIASETYCYEITTGNTYIYDGVDWLPVATRASWNNVPIVMSTIPPTDAKLWFEILT